MNSLVFIALIAFLGCVAVQGYGVRRPNKHYRPPQKPPHRPDDRLNAEPHHRPHGPSHRPHHRPLESDSNSDEKPDKRRRPWDHSSEDDSFGSPFWESDYFEKSFSSSWEHDDDDSFEQEDYFFDSDRYYYFHKRRPPKRPKWPTTKNPRRKITTTPSPTGMEPSHAAIPLLIPEQSAPTWSMIRPIPERTTAESSHDTTLRPTRTLSPTLSPDETQYTTSSPPESTTNTDEEIPTLSPVILNCIETCISTPEYNPVCGTDGATYDNEGKLFCARSCGVDVTLRRRSVCPPPIFDGDDDGFPPPIPPPTTSPSPMARTTPFSSFQRCMRQCHITPSSAPVCGTDIVTYMNIDRLHCAQSCGQVVEVLCHRACPACGYGPDRVTPTPKTVPSTTEHVGSIPITFDSEIQDCMKTCPATPEYNPVCGSNHMTYNNPTHLLCAQMCGVGVSVVRFSPCSPPTSSITTEHPTTPLSPGVLDCIRRCPVTSEYFPVCGTDDLTYENLGHLLCSQYCGIDVVLKMNSRCPDDFGEPPDKIDSKSPTTENFNGNKDDPTTTLRTITSTTELTILSTTQVTMLSTTQETTTSTAESTSPSITQSTSASSTQSTSPSSTQSTSPNTTQSRSPSTTQSTSPSTTQSTSPSTTQSTTQDTTQSTTSSTTQETTPITTQETTPASTLTSTSPPILSSTLGFIIPQEILNIIFGSTTTEPPATTTTTTTSTSTTEIDEDLGLDVRFGNITDASMDTSKIIFRE